MDRASRRTCGVPDRSGVAALAVCVRSIDLSLSRMRRDARLTSHVRFVSRRRMVSGLRGTLCDSLATVLGLRSIRVENTAGEFERRATLPTYRRRSSVVDDRSYRLRRGQRTLAVCHASLHVRLVCRIEGRLTARIARDRPTSVCDR